MQVLFGVGGVPFDVGGVDVSDAHLHTADLPAQRMAVETLRIALHLHHRPPLLLDPFPRYIEFEFEFEFEFELNSVGSTS